MKQLDKHQIVGWIAVGLSIITTCVWAFWGIIETFGTDPPNYISGMRWILEV